MSPMKEETRERIRHLYFVDHVPLDAIARTLRVSRRAVRRALVLRGGAASHEPAVGPYGNDPTP